MENYNIRDLLRAGDVKRWHTVSAVKSQSLAEHQWNVAMLSANIAFLMGLDDDEVLLIILYALVHDIEEIWTGDVPSPARYRYTDAALGGRPPGASLPEDTIRGTDGPRTAFDDMRKEIVRAADLIDAYVWIRQFGVGDHAQEEVIPDVHDRLRKFLGKCDVKILQAVSQVMDDLGK